MNEERFERDLKSVLRGIAGGETPMSLRNRVADVIDRAPLGRRLSFAPPLKLSLAVVGAVAALALAVLFVGPRLVGPTPSQTPEPSASASATAAEPTPTVEPTAVPTPGVTTWTGLDWVVGSTAEGSCWDINDIVPWGDGYVGVGSSRERLAGNCIPTSPVSPAFFTSPDGLHWTIAQEGDAIDADAASQDQEWFPARIVPVGDTLLAVGHNPWGPSAPKLWRTEDGLSWSPLDSPTWREALATNELISMAAGPTGVVVVAAEGTTAGANPQGPPLIIHSSDGLNWDRLDLSSVFDNAYFRDVTTYPGGFVIVGRVGEAEVRGGQPPVGVPAAWTSPDGLTWLAAEVEGSEATGAELFTVVAGADGLFATGRQTDTIELSGQGPRSGWASTDGRSWQLLGEMGTDLPLAIDLPVATGYPANVDGDGAHMLMFGRESCKTDELSAWTSLDGVTWTQLTFSGSSYYPTISGPICNDDGTEGGSPGSLGLSYAAVMPDGVFVVASSSAPAPPTYWFLTATTD